jgi:hypothetical protein
LFSGVGIDSAADRASVLVRSQSQFVTIGTESSTVLGKTERGLA